MSATTDCYRCWRSKWKATGRFNTNRHGIRRAELICDMCGYAFSSGKPDAIQAGEAATATLPVPKPMQQPAVRLQGRQDMAGVGSLATDWKAKQAGEAE